MSEEGIEIKDARLMEAEQHHHVVIMTNLSCKEFPLAIGFANDNEEVQHMVMLDLHTANKLGEMFSEQYNLALMKIRGDT